MPNDYTPFDAFFFDFDGLLVNTENLHYNSYLEMVSQAGFTLDWDFTTYLSYALQSTEVLKNAVYDAVPNLYDYQKDWFILRNMKQKIYSDKLLRGELEFMSGADLFVEKLLEAGKTLCVVTNSPKDQIDIIKKHLPKLSLIKHWVTREQYENAKPSSDSYLKALDLLKPKKAIGFEDAIKGLISLSGTDIQAVHVKPKSYPTFDHDCLKDVWEYNSMHEVLKDFTTS